MNNTGHCSREGSSHCEAHKPKVVGLYGISGVGKSFLLDRLKRELGEELFNYHEGSAVIADIVPGGLEAFQSLEGGEKACWRKQAIETIRRTSIETGKIAVVTGHFMFCSEQGALETVLIESDLEVFTHILYLDESANVVWQRRQQDTQNYRVELPVRAIQQWVEAERTSLRQLCYDHSILFCLVRSENVAGIKRLLLDFQKHDEIYNLSVAMDSLDDSLRFSHTNFIDTFLVLDGDRTLTAEDTGDMLWRACTPRQNDVTPLKAIFSSHLRYSYAAFRQVSLLYEQSFDDDELDEICTRVASSVELYPEMLSLLRHAQSKEHIGAVIVTCGLRAVWTKILDKIGLSRKVVVIGGGRISDGFAVTPGVKAAIVDRLKEVYCAYVWAFGDSPLDLGMLSRADEAIVVVGDVSTRSQSMETELATAIDSGLLRARQLLLPEGIPSRLDAERLPTVRLESLMGSIDFRFRLCHSTDTNAAKLLATATRDARISGPLLREAHRRVGYYLSITHLSDLLGLETIQIPHVQGHTTDGFQLFQELRTAIIALMRGGEPMAFGVSDAFPNAMFLHARCVADIEETHLKDRNIVILVDSVINTGKSVLQMAQHIREINTAIQIVVVAGVVQKQAVSVRSPLHTFAREGNINLVALRLSANKYTGRGSTDTGNRLFSTVHLA
ncbi:uracil phosphoribosyltransferase [Aspergillus neoniger CBS 115656]|uniref:Uracil phosphoribosyltransferase n=1 Tax=Aspergillus neoniger (strain CBS 115656) TaxID=1448310 RepID=A0A318YRS6_ASPNB|nr:uracil phosphoribosyltransferase [Aspergillus neoniger CBS 115656]PYH28122.1 uracil phosphoribosyltransferase [Aspergillus neoniger CBS 115656]